MNYKNDIEPTLVGIGSVVSIEASTYIDTFLQYSELVKIGGQALVCVLTVVYFSIKIYHQSKYKKS